VPFKAFSRHKNCISIVVKFPSPDGIEYNPEPLCKKWGRVVAILLGSFYGVVKFVGRIYLKIPYLHIKNTFCSKKTCQNTSCAGKVLAAFGFLSNSATGSFETFSIPGPKLHPEVCLFCGFVFFFLLISRQL